MRDDRDVPELELVEEPPYPAMLTAAGVIWIVFGCLILLNLVVPLLLASAAAGGQAGAARDAALAGGVCGGLVVGLFAAVFIHVGYQSVRGTARDTLGNGVGSIIFALLQFGSGAFQARQGQLLPSAIGFICGLGLLAAGVLALVARGEYRAWRKATKVHNPSATRKVR